MLKTCNCVEECQSALIDNLKETKNYEKIGYVLINATAPIADKTQKAIIPATFSAITISKLGKEKDIEGKINVIARFCPFCGVKYEE